MPSVTIDLPASRTSPRAARRLWELAAEQWNVPIGDTTEVLLTEVVTNAVVHAGTDMVLQFVVVGNRLRVEVSDCSPRPLHPRHPNSTSENGRGLLLLDRLSSDWGWTEHQHNGTCKTVWFEIECTEPGCGFLGEGGDAFDIDTIEPL